MYKINVVGGQYDNAIALCDSMEAVEKWINEHKDSYSDYWITHEGYTMEYRDILEMRYR